MVESLLEAEGAVSGVSVAGVADLVGVGAAFSVRGGDGTVGDQI